MNVLTTEYGDMAVLYEDGDVISIVKPAGLLSQAAEGTDEKSVIEILADIGVKAHAVHRLDRTTGGVMIYAKNPRSAAALSAAIANGQMNKEYLAAVHGRSDKGRLEDMLYFDRKRNKSFIVKGSSGRRGVKKAQLEYETVDTAPHASGEVSLVRVRLMTGRTHQIRVQMAGAGHPLLGDGKYGGRDNKCNCALWSHLITFEDGAFKGGYLDGKAFAGLVKGSPSHLCAHPAGYPWNIFKKYRDQ